MRNRFDRELSILNTELIEMGALIENAIDRAVGALFKQDESLAESAIEFDSEVDRKERDIESRCLKRYCSSSRLPEIFARFLLR